MRVFVPEPAPSELVAVILCFPSAFICVAFSAFICVPRLSERFA
jgi:hypothetical protein